MRGFWLVGVHAGFLEYLLLIACVVKTEVCGLGLPTWSSDWLDEIAQIRFGVFWNLDGRNFASSRRSRWLVHRSLLGRVRLIQRIALAAISVVAATGTDHGR